MAAITMAVAGAVAAAASAVGVTGTIAAVGATVVGAATAGAVYGAAAGGLMAAVQGGDIGKGMLKGATMGAVVGGFGAAGGALGAGIGASFGGVGSTASTVGFASGSAIGAAAGSKAMGGTNQQALLAGLGGGVGAYYGGAAGAALGGLSGHSVGSAFAKQEVPQPEVSAGGGESGTTSTSTNVQDAEGKVVTRVRTPDEIDPATLGLNNAFNPSLQAGLPQTQTPVEDRSLDKIRQSYAVRSAGFTEAVAM